MGKEVMDSEAAGKLVKKAAYLAEQLRAIDGDESARRQELGLPPQDAERIYGNSVEAVASLKAAVLEVQDDLITQWFEGGGKLKTLARLGRLPRTTLIRRRRELESGKESPN